MADALQRGPKFRRRAEARPDEVLDAALALFVEKGFAATRVEDIAARAGLSKGAVYLYFPSKEAILEGLVKRAVRPIADNALGFLENYAGDPRSVIGTVLKMVAGRLADPMLVAIPRLLVREMVNFPELAQMYRREVLDRVIPAVSALIASGVREGYFRPVDPELTLRSVIGPVIAHMLMSELFGIRPAGGLEIERLIDNHLTILFDGLSAPQRERRFMAT
ncbi:MAG: TetR family transcriptional regulator [Devosia sp. 67-54]|uniref:TetR/AcrR family transcriptional regulator n=1 Tax=unclassified Devosia TaxID=196773 RepID=UPI00095F7EB6|nr:MULTISPECIES: TetR/AcrR family transcriptional regulator [unclassified Devosia]MBN9305805.1 TetR/AcrR family transcriptional regulator [Devosia sp.]OJX16489.1 MAG: TetR family transcriptional regulator [Devosia sp. 67-54]